MVYCGLYKIMVSTFLENIFLQQIFFVKRQKSEHNEVKETIDFIVDRWANQKNPQWTAL